MKEKFDKLVKAMLSGGIFSKSDYDILIKSSSNYSTWDRKWRWLMESYYDGLEVPLISSMLDEVGLSFGEDAESGQKPPPYESYLVPALLKFADLTKTSVINLDYNKMVGEDDTYHLNIIYNGKKYSKQLMDCGDYYDVEGLMVLINNILSETNSPIALSELDTEDQGFCFYKGGLDQLNSVLSEYKKRM